MCENPLDEYIPMMQFISNLQGPDTELVLYDVSTFKVHYVINSFDEEMTVGSEMRSLEKEFMEKKLYLKQEFIVNYRALSKSKHKLKSATIFIKGGERVPKALLTVNLKVDRLIELREMIDILVQGKQPPNEDKPPSFYDSFELSVGNMVTGTIHDELAKFGVSPPRLSYAEKIQLIRSLDNKGIFLVKGAIAELAQMMETTETTIYRYISKLSNDNPLTEE